MLLLTTRIHQKAPLEDAIENDEWWRTKLGREERHLMLRGRLPISSIAWTASLLHLTSSRPSFPHCRPLEDTFPPFYSFFWIRTYSRSRACVTLLHALSPFSFSFFSNIRIRRYIVFLHDTRRRVRKRHVRQLVRRSRYTLPRCSSIFCIFFIFHCPAVEFTTLVPYPLLFFFLPFLY